MATVTEQIATLLHQASQMSDDAAIVSIVDKVVSLMLAIGLAMYIVLPPAAVGVHPKNRYGLGLIVNNVHKLGASFKKMGFSMSACSAAVCVEDSEDGAIAKFTTRVARLFPLTWKISTA